MNGPIGAGSDIIKPVSFRRTDNFVITYGKDANKIEIPRLSFSKGEEVIRIITLALSQDASASLNIISMNYNAKQNNDAKKGKEIIDGISAVVEKVLQYKLYGMLKELLTSVSEGVITNEVFNELQFGEATGILQYLLNENLMPLKNLFASLDAITTSGNNQEE